MRIAIASLLFVIAACGSSGTTSSGNCSPQSCPNGTCDANGHCVIDCAGKCSDPVACPPGVACVVQCGDSGCSGPIDCTKASSCDIECGKSSCSGGINCGGSTCTINCASESCGGAIACNATDSCTVSCGSSCCSGNVDMQSASSKLTCGASSCSGKNTCGGPAGSQCTLMNQSPWSGGACCKASSCTVTPAAGGC